MQIQTGLQSKAEPLAHDAIHFEEGMYGFEGVREFELIQRDPGNPFMWLRATSGEVCFVVMDPRLVDPEYDFDLPEEAMKKLDASKNSQFVVLSIVVLPKDLKDMTINLKSPVVINTENRHAMQFIIDDERYQIRHHILKH